MSDEYDVYEFIVSVWEDKATGEWLYSVVQEFDDEEEVLASGSEDSAIEALESVSDFLPTLDFN